MGKNVDFKYDILDLKMIIASIDKMLEVDFDEDIEPFLLKVELNEDQIDEMAWKLRGIVEEYINPNTKKGA